MLPTDHPIRWLRQFELKPGSVLDVGCGNGYLSKELIRMYPQAEVYGLDMDSLTLAVALHRRNLRKDHAICGDAKYLGRPQADSFNKIEITEGALTWDREIQKYDEDWRKIHRLEAEFPKEFDLVFANDVAHMMDLEDWGKAMHGATDSNPPTIGEMGRAVGPGGHMLYSAPAFNRYVDGRNITAEKTREFVEEVRKDAEGAGLKLVRWKYMGDRRKFPKRDDTELDIGFFCRKI
ncbi:MAG: class I SAM-dependent methyltransferase [Candidatus Aenigmatarchaeota archaeon]